MFYGFRENCAKLKRKVNCLCYDKDEILTCHSTVRD